MPAEGRSPFFGSVTHAVFRCRVDEKRARCAVHSVSSTVPHELPSCYRNSFRRSSACGCARGLVCSSPWLEWGHVSVGCASGNGCGARCGQAKCFCSVPCFSGWAACVMRGMTLAVPPADWGRCLPGHAPERGLVSPAACSGRHSTLYCPMGANGRRRPCTLVPGGLTAATGGRGSYFSRLYEPCARI